MSLTIDALLTERPSHRLRFGLWLILAAIVVGLGWAHFTVLPRVVRATIIIEPVGEVQRVQHPDGGRLSELMVRAGDQVVKGQVLLRIDRTRAESNLDENLARQSSLAMQIARLRAESAGEAFVSDDPWMADQLEAHRARRQALASEQDVLTERARSVQAQLLANQSAVAAARDGVSSAREELEQFQRLQASGAVSKVEVLRLERELRERRSSLTQLTAERPRLQSERQALSEQINSLGAEFRSGAQQDLIRAQTELSSLRNLSTGISDLVKATEVLAPTSGTLGEVRVNTIGQVIQPGDVLMEIIPSDTRLQARAKVLPADIGFVSPDQPVNLRISTYDFSRYGVMPGRVSKLGANTVGERDSEPYYPTIILMDSDFLGGADNPLPIKVGMRGTADIITGQRTVLGYFLTPLSKIRYEAFTER
ncbi:HlyD family type I secretion periplasmic adaptor subunit [Litorivicinus lipolyticus]|uniref:Membrane fusion protein (MFP) family protein n=1 Tax=Litorivicinus lipolyticus TaxID=418701 RepID=A0A5Q2Q959_9GAMM|nr:HlyD family type I secretion periplasmic adaptor subunit [Litorivicinus lipolyticus]QGG80748.1 HlyD family type I secretion periplasmic adaptor subunit [Litorivicinus lipolyticus]